MALAFAMRDVLIPADVGRNFDMKAALLFAGSGPLAIVTSFASLTDPAFLERLRAKSIQKFIAYEIPMALAEVRYGGHFHVAMRDLRETDDLRVLDFNGEHAFRLFHMKELGAPILYEPTDAS